ncbi:50S ribosomal protein L18 [bacterium]
MNKLRDKKLRRDLRKFRIRKKIHGTKDVPRLVIFKSLKNLYAQLINDDDQKTIFGSSTLCKELKGKLSNAKNIDSSKKFAEVVAKQAKSKKIGKVVFDRNGYLYHGKVKAFAESLRENGMIF